MSRLTDDYLLCHPELLSQDETSDRVVRAVVGAARPMEAYFRFRLNGLERIPKGACLMVANHSAGAPHEVLLLLRAWKEKWSERPVRGLAHRIAWHYPFRLFPLIQKIGGLFAHEKTARAALARGQALLVFPGG